MTPPLSRAQAVLAAVQRELRDRQASLDGAANVVEVTVTIKLQPGTTFVRGTVYQETRTARVQAQADGHRSGT